MIKKEILDAKTILITGSTDGIGLTTAKMLISMGCNVLLHGRNPEKLKRVQNELSIQTHGGVIPGYIADLSSMEEVEGLVTAIKKDYFKLDVLINNAGVFNVTNHLTDEGLDMRFAVNTFAPYLLTKKLLPIMDETSRVVNLSSAAQSQVNPKAFIGQIELNHGEAYAQSKLALTMFSNHMANEVGMKGPVIVSVNPKSFLGSKLVKEAYGIEGSDLSVGADILIRASLSEEFTKASGKYYDNDIQSFANPHLDAMDENKNRKIVEIIEDILKQIRENNKN